MNQDRGLLSALEKQVAAEALLDPHADKRAQFLPKGDYKVVIEIWRPNFGRFLVY